MLAGAAHPSKPVSHGDEHTSDVKTPQGAAIAKIAASQWGPIEVGLTTKLSGPARCE